MSPARILASPIGIDDRPLTFQADLHGSIDGARDQLCIRMHGGSPSHDDTVIQVFDDA